MSHGRDPRRQLLIPSRANFLTGVGPRAATLPDLEGRQIKKVLAADLEFDPQNPRLPRSVNGSSERAVLEWMLRDSTILELMGSIGELDYFEGEPLLVVPKRPGKPSAPYIVVEGNRRLAAVMLLRDPGRAPIRRRSVDLVAREAQCAPEVLPVVVFEQRDQILDYLGYRHVTGIKEWDPLAKARYVTQLASRSGTKPESALHREIAKKIGSRTDYVDRLLSGLTVFEHVEARDFYGLEGVDEDSLEFAVLTTALSYKSIGKFIGLRDGDAAALKDRNLRDLIDWMYADKGSGTTILGESRDLRNLAAVVAEPEALKALRAGRTLEDAALLTTEPLRAFRKLLGQAEGRLRTAADQFHRVSEVDESDVELLSGMRQIVLNLLTLVRTRLEGDEEP